jgi:hypothetical protein
MRTGKIIRSQKLHVFRCVVCFGLVATSPRESAGELVVRNKALTAVNPKCISTVTASRLKMEVESISQASCRHCVPRT